MTGLYILAEVALIWVTVIMFRQRRQFIQYADMRLLKTTGKTADMVYAVDLRGTMLRTVDVQSRICFVMTVLSVLGAILAGVELWTYSQFPR